MQKFILFSLFSLGITHLTAQQTALSSSEILQRIEKLQTVSAVLYVAAHPDDENTRLLSYLASERKVRTGYLSLTRGDGGQNLIGKEQGSALGLIRTQELLAARRTDGAEQFFTRANDFGYSKNPEETFVFWNKDSVLADMVWTIRKFQPDVIICRFPTTGEGGHGHHTASAILAEEAFDAAADPKRFPEQLKLVNTWKTKRLFWNTFNFGSTNTTAEDQLKVDVGVFNPLIGEYYGEVAANSRSMHKSQGFGSSKSRGSSIEYFELLKGEPAKTDLLEGIATNWSRFSEGAAVKKLAEQVANEFDVRHPQKSVSVLVSLLNAIKKLPDTNPELSYWKTQKTKEVEQLLLECSGVFIDVFANNFNASSGESLVLTTQVVSKFSSDIELLSIQFPDKDTATYNVLYFNQLLILKHIFNVPKNIPYSNSYWLNAAPQNGLYTVPDQLLRGIPENQAALRVSFQLKIGKSIITISRNVVHKQVDPVKGEVYRPLEILPKVTINPTEKVVVFTSDSPKKITFLIKAQTPNCEGKLNLVLPKGWTGTLDQTSFSILEKGKEISVSATITMVTSVTVAEALEATNFNEVKLQAIIGKDTLQQAIQRIDYDHIPSQFILSTSSVKMIHVPMKISSGKEKIGYIEGAGDDVAVCLGQLGYDVTVLTDADLSTGNLAAFSAIVTGVRAYNTNERLSVHYETLMNYVKNGGNLVVQYNTNSRVGPIGSKIGPFPFTISRNRVTDETAKVTFTTPTHPVLNYPNKIEQSDFDNWIQERGIYFATTVDSNYQTVLSMNDPNEPTETGSLIIGEYGKGHFVYTGLAFFRELPAGVPGAYRLFVNLLSMNPKK